MIFDSGETEKTFDVLATDDDVDDDGEMVRLSFGALPDRVNEGGSASVSLVDNDERGVTVVPEQLRCARGWSCDLYGGSDLTADRGCDSGCECAIRDGCVGR